MYYLSRLYSFFYILSLIIFFFSTTEVRAKSFEINNIEISKPFKNNFDKNKVIDSGFEKAFLQIIKSKKSLKKQKKYLLLNANSKKLKDSNELISIIDFLDFSVKRIV